MGKTLGGYLRRRRVEVAAMRLASQPRLWVLDAAIAVGFGSGEAVARAFKARFGSSPTAWHRRRGGDQRLATIRNSAPSGVSVARAPVTSQATDKRR